jgi:wyosine [tRNA(Phe)-imidazoG37] synthetase (radical SAM superfamily)
LNTGKSWGEAQFLKGLRKLDRAYISIPTRPPSERWVKPAKGEAVNFAYPDFL